MLFARPTAPVSLSHCQHKCSSEAADSHSQWYPAHQQAVIPHLSSLCLNDQCLFRENSPRTSGRYFIYISRHSLIDNLNSELARPDSQCTGDSQPRRVPTPPSHPSPVTLTMKGEWNITDSCAAEWLWLRSVSVLLLSVSTLGQVRLRRWGWKFFAMNEVGSLLLLRVTEAVLITKISLALGKMSSLLSTHSTLYSLQCCAKKWYCWWKISIEC